MQAKAGFKWRVNMARILIADDSTEHRQKAIDLLQKNSHEVITANNGMQAFELAVSESPDLILMDIVMPVLNGFQATRKISHTAETSHIPIIMLTAKEQEADRVWAIRQGAKDYIAKPPNEEELIGKITALLNS